MPLQLHQLSLVGGALPGLAQWLLRLPGDDLAGGLVILPSSRAAAALRHALLDAGSAEALLLPTITTPRQLCDWLAGQHGTSDDDLPHESLRPLLLAPRLASTDVAGRAARGGAGPRRGTGRALRRGPLGRPRRPGARGLGRRPAAFLHGTRGGRHRARRPGPGAPRLAAVPGGAAGRPDRPAAGGAGAAVAGTAAGVAGRGAPRPSRAHVRGVAARRWPAMTCPRIWSPSTRVTRGPASCWPPTATRPPTRIRWPACAASRAASPAADVPGPVFAADTVAGGSRNST